MTRGIAMKILLTLVVQTSAVSDSSHDARDPMDKLADSLLNKLADRVLGGTDLDHATLGKPGQLSVSRTSGTAVAPALQASRQVAPRGPMMMPPIQAQARSDFAAREGASHSFGQDLSRHASVVARAVTEDKAGEMTVGDNYVVEQPRPIGIKWQKCADGLIYAKEVDANADPRVQTGDKLIEVSASFGDEIWPASSYQQTMMAIKTRAGAIYMKIESRGGDMAIFDLKPDMSGFKSERMGGNYGKGTQEEQMKRYTGAKESARDRLTLFEDGLEKFRAGEYNSAINDFAKAKDLEPPKYVGDRFERVTQVYKASAYNIACCYSKMNDIKKGLAALRDCMNSGFEDYKKIRSDPNLAELRESPDFKTLMDQFDEPLFNAEAFEGLKDLSKMNPFKQFR